jgi:DNA-binding HxlR family transcriptional regulator
MCPTDTDTQSRFSITHVANLVGDRWLLLIITELMGGTRRFNELQDSLSRHGSRGHVSISPKTLSQRLKFMEANGLILRESYAEIPPRVEYSLTEKGQALYGIIKAMSEFEAQYMADFECHGGPHHDK